MTTKIFHPVLGVIFSLFLFTSCNNTNYEGTYTGTLPCADCSGIYTEITVSNNKYMIKRVYLTDKSEEESTFVENGIYTWSKSDSILIFDQDPEERYRVKGNTLIALDQDGKEVTGNLAELYILKKK